jgi:amphi-Trp domain-containing protein
MSDKADFEHEALIDAEAVSAYLRSLADGFDKRTLRFSDQNGELILYPKGLVGFEVTSKTENGRAQLQLNFSWKQRQKPETGKTGTLQIEARDNS